MKLQRKSERKFFKAKRERLRMLALNKALVYLRSVLQTTLYDGFNDDFDRLPKIEILRLAKNYIQILMEKINGKNYDVNEFLEKITANLKYSTRKMLKNAMSQNEIKFLFNDFH